MTRPKMHRGGVQPEAAAPPAPEMRDAMPAWIGKGRVPYALRNDHAPAPAEGPIDRYWWPRPIAWRGLVLVADDVCEDQWRTARETIDDPWCWSLMQMPYNPDALWAGHLRLGADRYHGRGFSPAEAFEAAILQARWAVLAIEDALRQVGEVIAE